MTLITQAAVDIEIGSIANGVTTDLGSNKSGWLQTFLNCIKTFIIPIKFPPCMAFRVEDLAMNSSYRNIFANKETRKQMSAESIALQ